MGKEKHGKMIQGRFISNKVVFFRGLQIYLDQSITLSGGCYKIARLVGGILLDSRATEEQSATAVHSAQSARHPLITNAGPEKWTHQSRK